LSHLHIPDGIIPLPWIVLGLAATAVLVAFSVLALRRQDPVKVVPRIGVLAALMLAAMSLPIPVLNYHVNLTVLAGIIAGPAQGFIGCLIANVILALTGHGGITVVGINTVVTGIEVLVGWAVWTGLRRVVRRPFALAAATTVIALALSTTAMLGVVAGTQINPGLVRHAHEKPAVVNLEEQLIGEHIGEDHGPEDNHPDDHPDEDAHGPLSLGTFAAVVYSAGMVGWAIEAAIIGAVAQFLARARPDLIGAL
jgi:cobalt/nickel transport system permease protein